ncbi:MAG: 3-dehydroquinate synthase, partial [Cyanobacteria bacterium P01_C01_bin.118]
MVATVPKLTKASVKTFLQESIQQRFAVAFQYDVHFTQQLFHPDNALLAKVIATDGEPGPKKIMVIVDDGLLPHHPELLSEIKYYGECYDSVLTLMGAPVVVPGGETAKHNSTLVECLQQHMDAAGLCRHSYVIGIGGGAVLDMVGYAAATAHRGIRLIRVPTTVLAQNDSGVGVKNSVNCFGKKNFLGTFAPPYAVLNDTTFLTTL